LIRVALASCADTVIFPIQDVLGLDTHSRMNVPGTAEATGAGGCARTDYRRALSALARVGRLYDRLPTVRRRRTFPFNFVPDAATDGIFLIMLMQTRKKTASKNRRASRDIWHRLDALARNLWWSWQPDAQRFVRVDDPAMWTATHHNPIKTMRLLSPSGAMSRRTDPAFAATSIASSVTIANISQPRAGSSARTKGASKEVGADSKRAPLIAYFCAEFAVHESLPQYSGGSVCWRAIMSKLHRIGRAAGCVGLLYRNGYYTQEFAADGSTRVIYRCLISRHADHRHRQTIDV